MFAKEGEADSYWGNIPQDKTFAFADSRYYDGTDYVKVFNVGLYTGTSGEYYYNGDWTDLTKVYRRADYYATPEIIEYTETASPGQVPRPDGYPTNDVGGDADGALPSYNAGVYTTLSWNHFDMFGRKAQLNYNYDGIVSARGVSTYVEIWKVAPELTLTMDKSEINRGDTFTLSLTIQNHFNNMEGLPKSDEVVFQVDHATAVSEVTKQNHIYTQTFRATEDTSIDSINIQAGVLGTATNYKEAYETLTVALPGAYSVSYKFISGTNGKKIPGEVTVLLPKDEAVYQQNLIAKAIWPKETSVIVEDGIWKFQQYDEDSKIVTGNVQFTGTWVFVKNESAINEIPVIDAEDKMLDVGDAFNPLDDATASDREDGDLTKKLEVLENTVDTSKVGVYKVTYKVTDSQGASTTKTILVTIKQKTMTSGQEEEQELARTGDTTSILLWSAAAVLSLAGMALAMHMKRKS